jgi:hypothetical protein
VRRDGLKQGDSKSDSTSTNRSNETVSKKVELKSDRLELAGELTYAYQPRLSDCLGVGGSALGLWAFGKQTRPIDNCGLMESQSLLAHQ